MKPMSLRPDFRLLALLAAFSLGAAGCSNTAGGVEAGNRQITSPIGSNIVRIDPANRRPPPSFSGALVTGGSFAKGEHLGSVTVVNFWGSWCPPCIEEQPLLERTWKKYEARGVLFIGIDVRDTIPNAKAHIEDFRVTYPSIFDPDQRLAHAFRVPYPPATFVLDREGRVAVRVLGALTEAGELDVLIDGVLAE